MHFLNFSLFIFVNFVAVISAKEHVPVLLWSSQLEVSPVSSLKQLSAAQFSQLLHDGIQSKPNVVVFLEDSLSVEDFSIKSNEGKPAFHHLSKKLNTLGTKFLPSVTNPMKAIHLLRDSGYDWIHYDGEVPSNLKTPTVIVVSLEDESFISDRHELLRSHDRQIAQIYEEVEIKYPQTLAVYTGRRDTWVEAAKISNRVRRSEKAETEEEEPYDGVVIIDSNLVIIANSIVLFTDKDSPKNLSQVQSTALTNDTDGVALKATFSTGDSLTFFFNEDAGTGWQWFLKKIEVTNATSLTPPDPIWAPFEWSYYCGNIVFKSTADYPRVVFKGLQVQPNVNGKFGEPIDCVPYFSMAIWSGIIISLMLLSILSLGITMLMDVNTNDRFDDPKGKTITINAAD